MSADAKNTRPLIPRFIHAFAVPLLLGWVALTVLVNVAVPSLEDVGQEHSVSFSQRIRLRRLGDDRLRRRPAPW
jgi:putative drug exporter of the RND superfamily